VLDGIILWHHTQNQPPDKSLPEKAWAATLEETT